VIHQSLHYKSIRWYSSNMTLLAKILSLPVKAYRLALSSYVGQNCRFQPTCSAYALEALEKHGGIKGGYLATNRICRCHPWGGSGIDNVP
jgi:putative membrane protein insertion efficiency factor